MNTPTTEQIEAVLDPLLDRLGTAFKSDYLSISRQLWGDGDRHWRASISEWSATGGSPTEAVVNLIAKQPELLAERRAKLQAELAALEAQEAKL